jgi:malonate-semialdehyde dehydrogenase (acetylating) / methylmalonate-semialdehyde dehydrogenase
MPDVPELQNYVGGAWVRPQASGRLDVFDPSDGSVIARVPRSGPEDVDVAVQAAQKAFLTWRDVPVSDRARALLTFRHLLDEHSEELARSITREQGKTLAEARGSVFRALEATDVAASAPTTMQGFFSEDVAPGIDTTLLRQPVGVVAGITPFNFPIMIPLWMAPFAIVCGNTFLLKPSERDPLSPSLLPALFEKAGFPPGVFNLVHGDVDAVNAILTHPGIHAVSFVGSAPTAKHVYTTASAHGKRVQALAGAKNFMIVMPDADLKRSVSAIVSSACGMAGERCLAGAVVVAVEPGADRLVEALAEAVRTLVVGPASDPKTEMGPVIRAENRDRILKWVQDGVAAGAKLVARGSIPPTSNGFFVAPVLLDHVRPEMSVAQEEIFGPVLTVIRVNSLEEGLEVANRSRFGNASSIFTQSGKAAREFTRRVEAGMLGINIGVPAPVAPFPFVGWKGSFFGDLHATGRDAIDFYTRKKVVTSRWF